MKGFAQAFVWALRGVADSVRRGRNIRIEMVAAVYALLLSAAALTGPGQWAAVLVVIGMVLGAEICNTAIEALCDKVCKARCEEIRFVKDAAAGAVLICALTAAAVGGLLFFGFGGLDRLLAYCRKHIWYPILLAVLAPPALWFVCRKPRRRPSPEESYAGRRPK
ncbi:MAG: diacylglycerol kinase family protein [Clostridiales bacterium]|nr:diacylglycerol kinase family protein [Clostridiales bacterium]